VNVRIPAATVDVPGLAGGSRWRSFPNPARAGETVVLEGPLGHARAVGFYDLAGRQVGHAAIVSAGAGLGRAAWTAVGANGAPLAAGVYFARVAGEATRRLVVVAR